MQMMDVQRSARRAQKGDVALDEFALGEAVLDDVLELGQAVIRRKQAIWQERPVVTTTGRLAGLGAGLGSGVWPSVKSFLFGLLAFAGAGLIFAVIVAIRGVQLSLSTMLSSTTTLSTMPWNQWGGKEECSV
jgi:hypothetical protein